MAKANNRRASADFSVGRGKPPAHSRFKPGQSGNPGGRKKGSRNMKSVLEDILLEEIEMTENGKKRSVSLLEALIKRAVQEGLRGDLRAIKDLLDRYERHVGSQPEVEEELPEQDKAILQRFMALRDSVRTADPRSRPVQDYEGRASYGDGLKDGDDE